MILSKDQALSIHATDLSSGCRRTVGLAAPTNRVRAVHLSAVTNASTLRNAADIALFGHPKSSSWMTTTSNLVGVVCTSHGGRIVEVLDRYGRSALANAGVQRLVDELEGGVLSVVAAEAHRVSGLGSVAGTVDGTVIEGMRFGVE